MTDFSSTHLGHTLARARSTGAQLPESCLAAPPDLAASAQAQAAFFQHGETLVRAWKVAIPAGGGAVSAPLFPLLGPASEVTLPWTPGLAFEVEIAVRLATDLPAPRERPYRRADIASAIASVHLGIEIIRSRIMEGSKAPFLTFHADLLGNDGYVLGSDIPGAFIDKLEPNSLVILTDRKPLYAAPPKHPNGDVLAPLLAYANAPTDCLGGLRAGQYVTTGSLCGVLNLPQPSQIRITFAGQHELTVNFAKPHAIQSSNL